MQLRLEAKRRREVPLCATRRTKNRAQGKNRVASFGMTVGVGLMCGAQRLRTSSRRESDGEGLLHIFWDALGALGRKGRPPRSAPLRVGGVRLARWPG